MVTLTRRQVLIAGFAAPLIPSLGLAAVAGPLNPEKLVLSGRILRGDGRPAAGAAFPVGAQPVVADADGRFVVVTDTGAAGPIAARARRDSEGTWRATLGLTLPAL